jgi:uncharacterized protein YbjT (DUF2867 family)
MTILVIGGTGTLGRQIVRELLNSGYSVRCFVRNIKKATFLKEWGADLVYGDLKLPETIPNTLKGIRTIIDISTLRNGDDLDKLLEIDLIGKMALIKAAKIGNIEGFIFFSIKENKLFESIPLMKLKVKIEKTLKNSRIPYTILQLSGFYQGLINQYAIPILEQETIFITKNVKKTAFINTQDVAKILLKLLIEKNNFQKEKIGHIIEINGPKLLNSNEIISLCEEIGGQSAKIKFINIFQYITKLFKYNKWTWNLYDRLKFMDFLSKTLISDSNIITKKFQTKIYKEDMNFLENYIQEYFENMLKKLKDINYDNTKTIKRKDLNF